MSRWFDFITSVVVIFAALTAADVAQAADARGVPASTVAAGAANAVPNQPGTVAVPAQTGDFENTPLSFPVNPRHSIKPGQRPGMAFSIFSAVFYVFVVCAVFVAIIWLAKRYLPGHKQFFSHPALEVLGRTHLDQRRYVSLLRVGRRILVVGVTPDAINPLSEVSDGAEVAEIMEQARPKNEAGKTIFQKLFQRHMIEADQTRAEGELESKTEALIGDLAALRSRLQTQRHGEEAPVGIDRLG